MNKDCRRCDYFEPVGDGYGMCTKEPIPILVLDNYELTDNFLKCQKCKTGYDDKYGEMAYQKEDYIDGNKT